MTTQDSDSVKAIKALEDVEKHLQNVRARVQSGSRWAWQQEDVAYIDVFGFQDVTDRAGKAIAEAAPLFEVYLHALGRVPPRFKAVFEQAAALMDWIGSLEYQYGSEYRLSRALQKLQRVESGLGADVKKDVLPFELCTEETEKYFLRAEEAGYMDGHKWLKSQVQLGYFCIKVFAQPRPINALEEFFGIKKLSASITQAECEPKRADVKKWRDAMDKAIFYD